MESWSSKEKEKDSGAKSSLCMGYTSASKAL